MSIIYKGKEYKKKPVGYKTVKQWMKEGKLPISEDVLEPYCAINKNGEIALNEKGFPYIYDYVSPDNVEPIAEKTIEDAKELDLSNKKIICFDTETTGFSKWDEIIQISIYDEEGEILNTYIKPIKKKTWPKASEINHIYPEDVKDYPTTLEMREKINKIFSSADVLIGHNVAFDIRMIKQCFNTKVDNKLILDTLQLFKEDVPEGKHKLRNAVEYYKPELLDWFDKGAHKSDTDTIATLAVFQEIIKRRKNKQIESTEIEFG